MNKDIEVLTQKQWYAQRTNKESKRGQGMVVDEQNGRTVAVSYDAEDTALLAAAPMLLNALKAQIECTERLVTMVNGYVAQLGLDAKLNFAHWTIDAERAISSINDDY